MENWIERMKLRWLLRSHEVKCRAYYLSQLVLRQKFLTRYPRVCKTCGGYGGEQLWGSFNPISGTGSCPKFIDCPDCIDKGLCPLCRTHLPELFFEEADIKCPECDWSENTLSVGVNCLPEDPFVVLNQFPCFGHEEK